MLNLHSHHTSLLHLWATWQYAQSLSVRTVTERAWTVRRMAEWCGVAPELATLEHIVRWLAEGADSDEGWSARTRWTYHSTLRAWFSWLQTQGHRIDNPMLHIPSPRRPKSEPRPVTDEELGRILRVRMWKRTRAMALLATLQGLRVHEIAKVKGEHFDLIARTMIVHGKGNVTKVLPLHPLVVEIAYQMPRKGHWFPSKSGGHVRRESVSHTLGQVFTRAGVQGAGHRLRHWYCTALLEAGVDLRTTQELARHASIQSTQIYTQVKNERRAEGIERLQLPIGGAPIPSLILTDGDAA
ncbi:site-specific recombinase, phage integrase [Mycobacteroides abscessus subsp. massiliense]|nr:site-specific recombinase, phage integrase [Mycobacteroides abscessus subsp. massiliense]